MEKGEQQRTGFPMDSRAGSEGGERPGFRGRSSWEDLAWMVDAGGMEARGGEGIYMEDVIVGTPSSLFFLEKKTESFPALRRN